MKKLIVVVSILVLAVFAVTLVNAQGPGFGRGQRMHFSGEGWQKQFPRILNLTDDQREKIQELQRKFTEETAQIRGNIMTKRLELRSLWADPKANPDSIRAKEKELRDLQNQLRDKALENRLELRKILTPEQISEFGLSRGVGPKYGCQNLMGYGKTFGYGHPSRCW